MYYKTIFSVFIQLALTNSFIISVSSCEMFLIQNAWEYLTYIFQEHGSSEHQCKSDKMRKKKSEKASLRDVFEYCINELWSIQEITDKK